MPQALFANSRPTASTNSNFSFLSLERFFLTVGQKILEKLPFFIQMTLIARRKKTEEENRYL
jgi:hypothetical protein